MSIYIDVNETLKRIQTDYNNSDMNEDWGKGVNFAISRILRQPTADAVEVVRCEDCKYMCHYIDGHLECRLLEDLKPIPTTYCTMNADDFCSYGERRENDIRTI